MNERRIVVLVTGTTNVIGRIQQCPDRHMYVHSPTALKLNADDPLVDLLKIAIGLDKEMPHDRHEDVVNMQGQWPLDGG